MATVAREYWCTHQYIQRIMSWYEKVSDEIFDKLIQAINRICKQKKPIFDELKKKYPHRNWDF